MKKYKPLRYDGAAVVFSEVPDEVSLAISITGCPRRCPGCHSEYLWEYHGNLLFQDLDALIRRYIGLITCVCFMGGDAENPKELKKCLKRVRQYGLKTALYSGEPLTPIRENDKGIRSVLNIPRCITSKLDYLKFGSYDQALGGLDNPRTNQMMMKRDPSAKCGWTDITYKFQNKKARRHLHEQYDGSTQEAPHPPSAEIHQRRLKSNAGVAAGEENTSHTDPHP